MFNLDLSQWPDGWLRFAGAWDLLFANLGALLITLLIIWWRQRTSHWFRLTMATLLLALLLCISSFSLFLVPPYIVSCSPGCTGWRGYPHPIATVALNDVSTLLPIDFLVNLLLLWLLVLGASVAWYLLGYGYGWPRRSWRARLLFVLLVEGDFAVGAAAALPQPAAAECSGRGFAAGRQRPPRRRVDV